MCTASKSSSKKSAEAIAWFPVCVYGKRRHFLSPGPNFEQNAEKDGREGGGKASLFGARKREGRVCIDGFPRPALGWHLLPLASIFWPNFFWGGARKCPVGDVIIHFLLQHLFSGEGRRRNLHIDSPLGGKRKGKLMLCRASKEKTLRSKPIYLLPRRIFFLQLLYTAKSLKKISCLVFSWPHKRGTKN